MGGPISVSTRPGAGSTFAVELAAARSPACTHPAAGRPPEAVALSFAQRRRILYIEDNLSNLTLVERILGGRDGIELLSAMQGTIGLELAREHRPDLVLLDMHLTDISGLELLKPLRSMLPHTPVVVLTADVSRTQEQTARRLGAGGYLTKPLDVREFAQTIREQIERAWARRPPAARRGNMASLPAAGGAGGRNP